MCEGYGDEEDEEEGKEEHGEHGEHGREREGRRTTKCHITVIGIKTKKQLRATEKWDADNQALFTHLDSPQAPSYPPPCDPRTT